MNSPDGESGTLDEVENNFKEFLTKVKDCLSGRSKQVKSFVDGPGDIAGDESSDEARCLEIVRRVLDEETVLEMVSTFLMFNNDHKVPATAKIEFHACHFDPESGRFLVSGSSI